MKQFPISRTGKYLNLYRARNLNYYDYAPDPENVVKATRTPEQAPVTRSLKPFERHLKGFGPGYEKNILEKTLDRLELDDWRLFPKIKGDEELTKLARIEYQKMVAEKVIPYISSQDFSNMSPEDQRFYLQTFIAEHRSGIVDTLEKMMIQQLSDQTLSEALTKDEREKFNRNLTTLYKIKLHGMDKQILRKAVTQFKNMMSDVGVKKINLSDHTHVKLLLDFATDIKRTERQRLR